MSPAKFRLAEDKALRDAARNNVDTDLELIKTDVERKGIGARLAETASATGRVAADEASGFARDNKGALSGFSALALAGLAAWIFRGPLKRQARRLIGRDPEPSTTERVRTKAEQVRRQIIEKAETKFRHGDRK